MKKEMYVRAEMDIVRFYTEDAITTSSMIAPPPVPTYDPNPNPKPPSTPV